MHPHEFTDTDPRAMEVWLELLRQMPPGERLASTLGLSDLALKMADAAVRRRITDQSMEIPPRDEQTPEALGTFQRAEIAKWCDAKLYLVVLPLCGGRRAAN